MFLYPLTQRLPRRLREIAQTRDVESVDAVLKRIQVISVQSTGQLTEKLNALTEIVGAQDVGLIVVDSIAALARREFEANDIARRQQCLMQQASILKYVYSVCVCVIVCNARRKGCHTTHSVYCRYIAGAFEIPVIVTNQARFKSDDEICKPALGNSWSHCVNTRVCASGCCYSSFGRCIHGLIHSLADSC